MRKRCTYISNESSSAHESSCNKIDVLFLDFPEASISSYKEVFKVKIPFFIYVNIEYDLISLKW